MQSASTSGNTLSRLEKMEKQLHYLKTACELFIKTKNEKIFDTIINALTEFSTLIGSGINCSEDLLKKLDHNLMLANDLFPIMDIQQATTFFNRLEELEKKLTTCSYTYPKRLNVGRNRGLQAKVISVDMILSLSFAEVKYRMIMFFIRKYELSPENIKLISGLCEQILTLKDKHNNLKLGNTFTFEDAILLIHKVYFALSIIAIQENKPEEAINLANQGYQYLQNCQDLLAQNIIRLCFGESFAHLSNFYFNNLNFKKCIRYRKSIIEEYKKQIQINDEALKEQPNNNYWIENNRLMRNTIEVHNNIIAECKSKIVKHREKLAQEKNNDSKRQALELFAAYPDANTLFVVGEKENDALCLQFKEVSVFDVFLQTLDESKVKHKLHDELSVEVDTSDVMVLRTMLAKFAANLVVSQSNCSDLQVSALSEATAAAVSIKNAKARARRHKKRVAAAASTSATSQPSTSEPSLSPESGFIYFNDGRKVIASELEGPINANYQQSKLIYYRLSPTLFQSLPIQYHERVKKVARSAKVIAASTKGVEGHVKIKSDNKQTQQLISQGYKYKLKLLGSGIGDYRPYGKVTDKGQHSNGSVVEVIDYDYCNVKGHS